MVSFWPWAHESIFLNPLKAFKTLSDFTISYPVFFNGQTLQSNHLPWYYLPKFILITTPPFFLLFALIGLFWGLSNQIKKTDSNYRFLSFITHLWFFFPIVYFILKTPNVYDGLRHFLFILPAFSIIAGCGAVWIIRHFTRYSKIMMGSMIALLLLLPASDLVRLHPYQMTYFNFFSGGLAKASKKYETEYWTSSYKEAIEWIKKNSNKADTIHLLVAGDSYNYLSASYYRAPEMDIKMCSQSGIKNHLPPNIDYYIATTRWNLDKNFPFDPIVHTIGRDDAIFTIIKKNKRRFEN
jgi:hypothetical protein